MKYNTGAKWWKFDMHTHSPASFDYGRSEISLRKDYTPRAWLKDYIEKGINCVAVTDHNTGDWIDKLINEAEKLRQEGENIHVFPGVEISANHNIHILAIFDPSKGSAHIYSLLGRIRFDSEGYGKTECVSPSSVEEVARIIKDMGGVAIPAHIDLGSGLCQKVNGATLKQVTEVINAVEVVFKDEQKEGTKELLSGFRRLKTDLVEIVGSDSHHPKEVGRAYTWVKMSTPSIEGLRLSLHDGLSSIIRSDEQCEDPNVIPRKYISELSISNTKYCGRSSPLEITFHPWMNSIIGGRGSGKSSMIEFIRLGAERSNELLNLDDSNEVKRSFLSFSNQFRRKGDSGVLLGSTIIKIGYVKDATEYLLEWKEGQVNAYTYDSLNDIYLPEYGSIEERFPVRIFSQKQIFSIAKSPNTLLSLIDESDDVGRADIERSVEEVKNDFISFRAQQREAKTKLLYRDTLRGKLSDINRKISIIESSGHIEILNRVNKASLIVHALNEYSSSIDEILNSLSSEVCSYKAPVLAIDFEPYTEECKSKSSELTKQVDMALADIKKQLDFISSKKSEFNTWARESELYSIVSQNKQEYDDLVKRLKSEGVNDLDEYQDLIKARNDINEQIISLNAWEAREESLRESIKSSYKEIVSLRKSLSRKRFDFIDKNFKNDPSIQVSLQPLMDESLLEVTFRKIISREDASFASDIYNPELDSGVLFELHNRLSVIDGIDNMDVMFSTVHSFKKELISMEQQGLSSMSVSKRFHDLITQLNGDQLDKLNCWFPEDKLQVSYSTDGKRFKDITEGSAGQKSATILTFLLSFGDEPLVLDQPEDDLDNKLIYDLVVDKLKKNKSKRQVIVVTHNPNIVVNGDSELVICLHESRGQIDLQSLGSLQETSVRKSVCDIMEGGKSALEQRYRRIVNSQ